MSLRILLAWYSTTHRSIAGRVRLTYSVHASGDSTIEHRYYCISETAIKRSCCYCSFFLRRDSRLTPPPKKKARKLYRSSRVKVPTGHTFLGWISFNPETSSLTQFLSCRFLKCCRLNTSLFLLRNKSRLSFVRLFLGAGGFFSTPRSSSLAAFAG